MSEVYQIVTDRVLSLLEKGVVPWVKPWASLGLEPKNFVTRKPYRGINSFLLGCSEFASPLFLTFKQVQDAGGSVRKGEKSLPVVFWKMFKKSDVESPDDAKNIPMLRYYRVFNVLQCDGIPLEKLELPVLPVREPLVEAEAIVSAMPHKPLITETVSDSAFYRLSDDKVTVPLRGQFDHLERFYGTLFHELVHSTGHPSRLDRNLSAVSRFGSQSYAREELVAEMGAGFLCAHAGIENTVEQSAAYIANWLKALKNDNKLVIHAAAQAQKAVDLIMNIEPNYQPN